MVLYDILKRDYNGLMIPINQIIVDFDFDRCTGLFILTE